MRVQWSHFHIFLENCWYLFCKIRHSGGNFLTTYLMNNMLLHRWFHCFFAATLTRNAQIFLIFYSFKWNLEVIGIGSPSFIKNGTFIVFILTHLVFMMGWKCGLEILVNDLVSLSWGRWAAISNILSLTITVIYGASNTLNWGNDGGWCFWDWYNSRSGAVLKRSLNGVHIFIIIFYSCFDP
jgi:hypothetical protein